LAGELRFSKTVVDIDKRSFTIQILLFDNGSFVSITEGQEKIGGLTASIGTGTIPITTSIIPAKSESLFLKLISEQPMTSRDIKDRCGGRSREHISRLMKKLFDDGFVERNTTKRPYTYSITDSGKGRIGSKENIVYAVSQ